jgi:hypothetical protein
MLKYFTTPKRNENRAGRDQRAMKRRNRGNAGDEVSTESKGFVAMLK